MSFSFQIVGSDEVRCNILAMHWLDQSAIEFGGITSVEKCLQQSDDGHGFFIFCKKAIKLRGVIYIVLSDQEVGSVLTLMLLGGNDLLEWSDDLRDFLYKIAKELDCDQFYYMGRKGFSRIFPELEEVARVYRKILKPDLRTLN